MRRVLLFICFYMFCALIYAQSSNQVKSYITSRLTSQPPKIDGLENDSAWSEVPWGGEDFVQRQPNDGKQPTAQTRFKILYDDKNLYVLIRALDPEPQKIVNRLSRRDGFDGDRVTIMIDSYLDKRTAFSFTSSVSGVKGDEYVSNDGDNWDDKWDPIWYLETSVDQDGWLAEFRIPLSQLRFANKEVHTWGLQFGRYIFRNDEWSHCEYIPQNASGWVRLFGTLDGITGVKPQKQLEIQPYVLAQTQTSEREQGNPFETGKSSDIDFGLDAKVGITSDITLDLTINPDFGQVEADPSQVNLSAFQLFFPEQRPFFIEGNNILTFPLGNASDNLFYSRRIGRKPQGSVDTDENGDDDVEEFVNTPQNSRILGSMKLTGKNKNGFSWGLLEAITQEVRADIDSLGFRKNEVIEPSTNYLVGRFQQDLKQGKTVLGGMVTATNRGDLKSLDLPKEAYSAGADIRHFWSDRKYFISGSFVASQVRGSEQAIHDLQESSVRFYQRPNNNYRNVDTTRTKMEGTAGSVVFGKRTGNIIYDVGTSWSSPGLALNDIGFLAQTDQVKQWAWMQYRRLNPFGPFRWLRWNIRQEQNWDFGGEKLLSQINSNLQIQLKNFFRVGTGGRATTYQASNADLRGGPTIRYPRSHSYWIWAATDERKKIRFELNPWWNWSQDGFMSTKGWWTRLTLRPTDALNISFTGSIRNSSNEMQYVSTEDINGESRYLIAKISQRTYNLSLRMTYVLTPNLSIQYWGQPFASSGAYSRFKRVTQPGHKNYNDRFSLVSSALNTESEDIDIDENNDGIVDYSIDNPDFNITQFQSNMVLRWEYIPGSTLFLVWSQNLSESPSVDDHSFDHLVNSFFDQTPRNTFLIKYTYRFLL